MDVEDDKFFQNATEERKSREDDSGDELFGSNGPSKTSIQQTHSHPPRDERKVQRSGEPRTPLVNITPHAAKIPAGYGDQSPDDLSETVKSSKNASKSRPAPLSPDNYSSPPGVKFELESFVCSGLPDIDAYYVEVYKHNKSFSIHYNNGVLGKDALINEVLLSKILALILPEDDGLDTIMLKFSAAVLPGNVCFVEFPSPKKLNDFYYLVMALEPTIKTRQKPR